MVLGLIWIGLVPFAADMGHLVGTGFKILRIERSSLRAVLQVEKYH
jgi:hypothetical protein